MEQGVLSGKYRPGEPPPEGSRATHESDGARFIRRVLRDDVLAAVQQLVPLAQAENLTIAQLAIAWVLQNDNVASAITGGSRPEQVTSNAAAAEHRLSPETMAGINSALSGSSRDRRCHGGRDLAETTPAMTWLEGLGRPATEVEIGRRPRPFGSGLLPACRHPRRRQSLLGQAGGSR